MWPRDASAGSDWAEVNAALAGGDRGNPFVAGRVLRLPARPRRRTVSRTGEEFFMDTITYTAARAKLAQTMDRVCDDHEPLIITRSRQQSVVMMSLEDFKALEETAYLLRAPRNAKRLLEAISSLEGGDGKERRLAE
jgi:antitoxin YefM